MLFVSILQFVAVSFTITSLFKDELMISPEEHGVKCNITAKKYFPKTITAQHLIVYWRWQTLEVRWDFMGQADSQIWLSETYTKTYDCRCKGHCTTTPRPTHAPTGSTKPPTHNPTEPTKAPHPRPTKTPKPTKTTLPPSKSPTKSPTLSPTDPTTMNQRKLLYYEDYDDNGEVISFEVPQSLQYDSVLSTRSLLPSIFYPLPPLQKTYTYGQGHVEYVYPFKVTKVYRDMDDRRRRTMWSSSSSSYWDIRNASNNTNITTLIPTEAPTAAPSTAPTTIENGCDDLEIVIETGKSYFSLLVCGCLFEGIGLLLLIAPTCHLVSIKTRRLIKQIVIGLNTLSFMLLLMAFAIWFAYFSTNINDVVQQEGDTDFSVCVLGTPQLGESIAWLLAGWIIIGFATMGSCYCSNRPKAWYRFLRQKRNFSGRDMNNNHGHHSNMNGLNGQLNINGAIQEESTSDIDSENEDDPNDNYNRMHSDHSDDMTGSDETDDSQENERLDGLMHRTPSNNSSGSNETYMSVDNSFGNVVMKGDAYPVTYSPMQ